MVAATDDERDALVTELFGAGNVPRSLEGRLLRTREVAILFQVSERAVTDWARKGRIPSVRTPGGHRRYPAEQVRTLLLATQDGGRAHARHASDA
jgi:excisionase family DNA binding protein